MVAFALVLTVIATLLVVIQPQAKWLVMSAASAIILGAYLVGLYILYRYGAGIAEEEASETSHSLKWGWIVFGLSSGAIFSSAPLLAFSAQHLAELTGISESFLGVFLVAIVTTLPELTTTAAAIRIGAPDLAIAGMYGTNAINIAILGVADFFSPSGSLFQDLDVSHVTAGLFAIILTSLGLVQIMLRRPLRRFAITEPSTLVMVVIYLLALFMVFRMG